MPVGPRQSLEQGSALQETSDKSVIELQQFARKNKPNLHILSKLQEEMRRLAEERVRLWSCVTRFWARAGTPGFPASCVLAWVSRGSLTGVQVALSPWWL